MDLIAFAKGAGPKLINTIKSLGPFMISQFDKASEQWQKHQVRSTQVDMLKELLKGEIEIKLEIKRKLLNQYINASDEEKIRLARDMEYVDAITRQVDVTLRSLSYSETLGHDTNDSAHTQIEEHWIDKFNELARKRNESWRADLLARALACEAADPGSVSPRALWLIGNMEEKLFDRFSDFLNLCIWFDGSPSVPDTHIKATARTVNDSKLTAGNLVYQLGDIGLISDLSTSHRHLRRGDFRTVNYHDVKYSLIAKQDFMIKGILLTPLGDSVAKFFSPKWNANGQTVLDDWIKTIKPTMAEVAILPNSSAN